MDNSPHRQPYEIDWKVKPLQKVFLECWRSEEATPKTCAREISFNEWQKIRRDFQATIIPGETHCYYLAARHAHDGFSHLEFVAIAKWHFRKQYVRYDVDLRN